MPSSFIYIICATCVLIMTRNTIRNIFVRNHTFVCIGFVTYFAYRHACIQLPVLILPKQEEVPCNRLFFSFLGADADNNYYFRPRSCRSCFQFGLFPLGTVKKQPNWLALSVFFCLDCFPLARYKNNPNFRDVAFVQTAIDCRVGLVFSNRCRRLCDNRHITSKNMSKECSYYVKIPFWDIITVFSLSKYTLTSY